VGWGKEMLIGVALSRLQVLKIKKTFNFDRSFCFTIMRFLLLIINFAGPFLVLQQSKIGIRNLPFCLCFSIHFTGQHYFVKKVNWSRV
jgi:hypothetical protein